MAEGRRMAAADVVAGVLAGEHGGFVREAVAVVARELIEAEVSAEIGATSGSRGDSRRPRPRGASNKRSPSTVGQALTAG